MEKPKNEMDVELKKMLGVLNAIRDPLLHILNVDGICLNEEDVSRMRPNQKQHLYAMYKSFEIGMAEAIEPYSRDVNKMNTFLQLAKNESYPYYRSLTHDGLLPEAKN